MKKLNIFYWISTALFSAFMLLSAIPNAMADSESVTFITQLGYPVYFIPFIGVAKIFGAITILIPGIPRLKEWAYAGLFFDLIGAMYSLFCVGTPMMLTLSLILPLALGALSYMLHLKRNTF